MTAGPMQHNLRLLAQHNLGGAPNAGEGMAIKILEDGRRFLYLAHENPPIAFSVLDVTVPAEPTLVWQLPTPHANVRGNSLTVQGDTLLQAWQTMQVGDQPAGFQIFDLTNPAEPEPIGFFDASGPHSKGVHIVSFMDGRYAHVASGAADFEPHNPKDHQFYRIVDLEDRTNPREVGRWWVPGQRKGDGHPPLERHPVFDHGMRPHHTLSYPQRPDRAYLGYVDAGFITLDISDKANPTVVARVDYHPPFPGFTHTVVPLFERGLLIVSDEANGDGWLPPGIEEGHDWPKLNWIVDNRVETNPVIISTLPAPAGFEEYRRAGGRIGAHNLHENEPEPGTANLQNTVLATWFSAGLRVYDIRDPFRPEEIAAFVPETPAGQPGSRISDVHVDDRGIIYATDREKGGLYVLEYTGEIPLD